MNNQISPSETSLQIAARIWCEPSCEKITMDPTLATEFARAIDQYREALIWCSGSSDFNEGGGARIGYVNLCVPLIDGTFNSIESKD